MRAASFATFPLWALCLGLSWAAPALSLATAKAPYGLEGNAASAPYLAMPAQADGPIPKRLSQTGAFVDTANLVPSPGLIPYEPVLSFWSDGAIKRRWMAAPRDPSGAPRKIHFRPVGEWKFPAGTVFVKHFELPIDETHPGPTRRLETRLLVCNRTGGVYGVTYKWRSDNSDADLLPGGLSECITIRTATGTRTQTWVYPSRQDCRTCHTTLNGGVLGVKTRQLNGPFSYASAVAEQRPAAGTSLAESGRTESRNWASAATDNQLRTWNHLGLFEPSLDESRLASFPALGTPTDLRRSLEDRARSYLDANCAHCHRPGGTVANFDARYDTPLVRQGLLDGPVVIDEGRDNARVVAPRDIWRSVLFLRMSTLEGMKMPPLAHQELDPTGIGLLRDWINSLRGRRVVPPPSISPAGGQFAQPVSVMLATAEPGAEIHYTLDGTLPTKQDPVYRTPLVLAASTVVRARAYKPAFTHSITAQQVFVVGE